MEFEAKFTIGDLLTVLIIVVTLCIYWRFRSIERTMQKASFIRNYTMLFYEPDVASMFFAIDYGRLVLDKSLLGTDFEMRLVKLLDIFNSVGFNYAKGIIELNDIDETTLGYAIVRTYSNSEVQKYLKHVMNIPQLLQ